MRTPKRKGKLSVEPSLPTIAAAVPNGVSSAKMGFMDGVDGKPSLTWAKYGGFSQGYGSGFGPYTMGPGSEVSRERSTAAAVTADLITSNSTVATLVENLATYAVGNGLTLSSRPDFTSLNITAEVARDLSNRIERAWQAWSNNAVECDASGRHNMHQLATAGFKSYIMTGELLAIVDWRKRQGSTSGTKIKLLDSRQLDQSISRAEGDHSVVQGVAFDKQGGIAGYWLRPFVLGNMNAAPQAVFVRANTSWGRARMMHLFDLIAPGQVRGLPILTAALSSAHAKGTLREYTLASALVQTMTATTIESDLPSAQAFSSMSPVDTFPVAGASPESWLKASGEYYSEAKVSLQPGVIGHLMKGDKLKMHRAESPNSTYESFDASLAREAAKASGSSYEDLSGDYSKTSFSASRLAQEIPWRINLRRRAAIVERFYRTSFQAFLEEACETGRIALPRGAPAYWEAPDAYSRCVWRGDGKPVADPLKAAQADILEIENGLSTLEAKLGERGLDLEEVLAQRKSEKDQLKLAGLDYPVPKNRSDWKPDEDPGDTVTRR